MTERRRGAEAAERAAAAEAATIRAEARRLSERKLADAEAQAAAHVAFGAERASALLVRVATIERELGTVLELLRSRTERLVARMAELEDLGDAVEVAFIAPTGVAEPGGEAGGGDGADGARLIALNMAVSGASLQEADRYLAENFDLPDRMRLLREVYGAVER